MLMKSSPLSGIYQMYSAQLTEVSGWMMADHYGNTDLEQKHLEEQCVLIDWSHIGKISLSGIKASVDAEKMLKGSSKVKILNSLVSQDSVSLRLTENDFLILTVAGLEENMLSKLKIAQSSIIHQTGSMGCFVLGGPRRDEVLERSTAVDLRRDRVNEGSVLQSTIHNVSCTIFRLSSLDILIHPRSFSESLFDALMDVGIGVGLVPAGLAALPVSFTKEDA
jgi:heterotetrameric sarcosine oxidase gamma subunit